MNSAVAALASLCNAFLPPQNSANCQTKRCRACHKPALSNNAIDCHICKTSYGLRKKKPIKKKAGRANCNKRCSSCNERAASNRAFKCTHCGHAFAKTFAARTKYSTKNSDDPVGKPRAKRKRKPTKNDRIASLMKEVARFKKKQKADNLLRKLV